MKCPECGQWNRASMPHCTKCGAPLNIDQASKLQWKDTLKDAAPSTAYLRADEFGQVNASPDARDQLAREMQDLKKRKHEGAERQRRLRKKTDGRSAPEVIVTEEPAVRLCRSRHDDVPATAIRVQPADRNIQSRRNESEIWHKVRFMDQNGAFAESRTYDPAPAGEYTQGTGSWYLAGPLGSHIAPHRNHRVNYLSIVIVLLIVAVLGTGGYFGYQYVFAEKAPAFNQDAIVTAALFDDLPGHTILIPGEEGTTIYIRELHASYVVIDGFATIDVVDHTWYDNLDGPLDETMDVTLTPFLKTSSGKQTPLPLVSYQIKIPLSPITLESPDSLRTTVSTTMKAIQITVRPGSHVTVNDKDYSDTVNSSGEMTYNAEVHPIGDNQYVFKVRSRYCRENSITVVLYREEQEITLDLAVGTYGTTNKNTMLVTATTLAGAEVYVPTKHSDLDLTEVKKTGKFSFYAIFDKIGDNRITIEASYPGMKTSVVNHDVYYCPPAIEYTPKAWPMNSANYSELLSNMGVRAERNQIYVITGVVQEIKSDKPQRVVVYSGEDGKSQPVLLENKTNIKKLEVGKYYRFYADAYSTFSSMPWLIARYAYNN